MRIRSTDGWTELSRLKGSKSLRCPKPKLVGFAGLYVHGDLPEHCGSLMLGVCKNPLRRTQELRFDDWANR